MSKYLQRLSYLVSILKANEYTSDQLLELLQEKSFFVSQRQLQRDLNALKDILAHNEDLKSYFLEGKKYFYIKTSSKFIHESIGFDSAHITSTRFYYQNLNSKKTKALETIETAIHQKKTLEIQLVKDDETGDNTELDASKLIVCPIQLICHRASYYLAGYNLKTETVEVYGIRQLVKIKLSKAFLNFQKLKSLVNQELNKRFGVTKNIDDQVYDIEIEFTSATGRFIGDHHWHSSQKITKANGTYTMTLRCGINRELVGWLFLWMYNVRIKEPLLLKQIYQKTLQECELTVKEETPFVYRNIFKG